MKNVINNMQLFHNKDKWDISKEGYHEVITTNEPLFYAAVDETCKIKEVVISINNKRYPINVKDGEINTNLNLEKGHNLVTLEPAGKATKDFDTINFILVYKSSIREWIETIFIALFLALIIRAYVVQAFYIPTGSMMDTLLPGDRILVNKYIYFFKEPVHQEIVIFTYPEDGKRDFIKRLIAKEGDTVSIKNGEIYLKKENEDIFFKVYEPYIKEKCDQDVILYNNNEELTSVTVPKGYYFVMGDNRNNSADSRYWGFVPKNYVKGRALFVYWPPKRIHFVKNYVEKK